MTKDGAVKWRTGANPNFGRGGMVLADGKLVIQDGNTGNVHLVKPDPAATKNSDVPTSSTNKAAKTTKCGHRQPSARAACSSAAKTKLKCLDLRKK